MIDNCASGGRRLDLEMMKRSVPLWRSDFSTAMVGQADAIRSINFNLTWWIPAHGGRSPVEYFNELANAGHSAELLNQYQMYSMRSFMSAGVGFGGLNGLPESTVAYALTQNNICKEMMYGDYYMLSHGVGHAVMAQNAAYQFNLTEAGRGYVISFRPTSGAEATGNYLLRGLEEKGIYRLENADTGESFTATGKQLMTQGLTCTYSDVLTSSLIYYKQIG
jgi:alpha-galactosidase